MKLHHVAMKGFLRTFGPVKVLEIDLDALPGNGSLIAVVGGNGEGKSHFMAALFPLPCYREIPYYDVGAASHVLPGVRDAFAETEFTIGGHRYKARIQADPQFSKGRGKTEAFLWRDGAAIAGPLVGDFDRALERIAPPKGLFYSSVFAAQGGGGSFFRLKREERRDLFAALLGLDHLQAKAELARNRAKEALEELGRVRTVLAPMQARIDRAHELDVLLEDFAGQITAGTVELAAADQVVKEHSEALAAARESAAKIAETIRGIAEQRKRLERERAAKVVARDAATAALASLDDLLGQREKIEKAEADRTALEPRIAAARKQEEELRERLRPIAEDVTRKEGEHALLQAEYSRIAKDLKAATEAAARVAAKGDIAADVARLEGVLALEESTARSREGQIEGAEEAAQREAEIIAGRTQLAQRIRDLKPRIEKLAAIDLDHPMCSRCPLTADAVAAKTTLEYVETDLMTMAAIEGTPAADRLRTLRSELKAAKEAATASLRCLSNAREDLVKLDTDRLAAVGVADLGEKKTAIVERGKALTADLEKWRAERATLQGRLDAAKAARETDEATLQSLKAVAAELPALRGAEAREEEQRIALATSNRALDDIEGHLATLPAPPPDPGVEARTTALREVEATRAAVAERVRGITADRATADGERRALGDPVKESESLRARESELAREASDWAVLDTALGREGVQALELDAASPGVSARANDLLVNCSGPRFSLALQTLRETKKGTQAEDFDCRIIDSELGSLDKVSGGEQVVIEQGLRIALGLYQKERSGYELDTYFLDETSQALSQENTDAYLRMLRRASELGNFHRTFFVSHVREAWQQADARIHIEGGEIFIS
jgi:exonuclease SbcC